MRELVPRKPEVVSGLKVVAGRDDSLARRAEAEEVRVRLPERGPRGEDAGGEVERYNARAAESSSSMSGTWAAS